MACYAPETAVPACHFQSATLGLCCLWCIPARMLLHVITAMRALPRRKQHHQDGNTLRKLPVVHDVQKAGRHALPLRFTTAAASLAALVRLLAAFSALFCAGDPQVKWHLFMHRRLSTGQPEWQQKCCLSRHGCLALLGEIGPAGGAPRWSQQSSLWIWTSCMAGGASNRASIALLLPSRPLPELAGSPTNLAITACRLAVV